MVKFYKIVLILITPLKKTILILFFVFIKSLLNAQTCVELCNDLLEKDKLTECSLVIDSCKTVSSDSALYIRAKLSLKNNNLKEANKYCNKLIKLNSNYYEVWFIKGLIASLLGNHELAVHYFKIVLEKNPKHLKALYNSALNKGLQEDYLLAIIDLDKCLEINPNYKFAIYSKGYFNELLGNYKEAIIYYSKVISIDANYNDAQLALAYTYYLNEEKDKACKLVEELIDKGVQAALDLKTILCETK